VLAKFDRDLIHNVDLCKQTVMCCVHQLVWQRRSSASHTHVFSVYDVCWCQHISTEVRATVTHLMFMMTSF